MVVAEFSVWMEIMVVLFVVIFACVLMPILSVVFAVGLFSLAFTPCPA